MRRKKERGENKRDRCRKNATSQGRREKNPKHRNWLFDRGERLETSEGRFQKISECARIIWR